MTAEDPFDVRGRAVVLTTGALDPHPRRPSRVARLGVVVAVAAGVVTVLAIVTTWTVIDPVGSTPTTPLWIAPQPNPPAPDVLTRAPAPDPTRSASDPSPTPGRRPSADPHPGATRTGGPVISRRSTPSAPKSAQDRPYAERKSSGRGSSKGSSEKGSAGDASSGKGSGKGSSGKGSGKGSSEDGSSGTGSGKGSSGKGSSGKGSSGDESSGKGSGKGSAGGDSSGKGSGKGSSGAATRRLGGRSLQFAAVSQGRGRRSGSEVEKRPQTRLPVRASRPLRPGVA